MGKINVKPRLPVINHGNSLTRGLVFDDLFFEGSGTKTEDDLIPGFGIPGTIVASGAAWDKNLYGIDLDFSAAASSVTYITPAYVNSLSTISIETIFYQRSVGGNPGRLLQKKNVTTNGYFSLQSVDTTHMRFAVAWSTTAGFWDVTIAQNTWYHYIVTYNYSATTNIPVIYLNGLSQTLSPTQTPVGNAPIDDTNLYIGNRGDGLRNFDGKIVYVRIWNRILNAQEAKQLYTNPWQIYMTYPVMKKQNYIFAQTPATVIASTFLPRLNLMGAG